MSKFPNSGILKRNPNRTSDKHPMYKGGAEVEGREYWMSAWVKTKEDGTSFMSIAFEPKEQPQAKLTQMPAKKEGMFDDLNDDVPF